MADAAQKEPENTADLLAPAGPPPRPWSYIGIGLGGASLLAIASMVLIRTYLVSRPLDLLPTTEALADHVTEVLRANLVPERGIKRGEHELRIEPSCHWYHYDFEIDLPPQMDVDGIRKLLVDGMAERQARVSSEEPLEFSIGPFPFAKVTFHGGAPKEDHAAPTMENTEGSLPATTATHEREELRLSALALANAAAEALAAAGAPEDSLAIGDPIEKEDDSAVWVHTRIQVADWTPASNDDLLASLATVATPAGALVSQTPEMQIAISLQGHPVVEIEFGEEAPMSVPAPGEGKEELRAKSSQLAQQVQDGLVAAGIPAEQIVSIPAAENEDARAVWMLEHLQVRGGTALAPEAVLAKVMERTGGPPVEGSVDSSAGLPELHIKLNSRLTVIVELQPHAPAPSEEGATEISPEGQAHEGEAGIAKGDPAHPKVAVILDDGGNKENIADEVLKLSPNLTLSILPHLKYSTEIAEKGAQLGFEIMLHMPMEPLKEVARDPGLLKLGMDASEIATLTAEAIDDVPGIVGINNHKGSKFTSDAAAMAMFFQAIKGKPYYFIDSVTASKSVAYTSAREAGFRAAKRSVFLDDKADDAYIRKQFGILRSAAKRTGSAIAIGHFRPHTVAVLADELEKLKRDGITLVHASELVQ